MFKIYGFSWLLMAVAAGVLLLLGYFNLTAAIVFCFICFGLVFMGMLSVLPASIEHHPSSKH